MPVRSPTVDQYMTAFPLSIDVEATVGDARRLMSEHNIHHLPVLEDGRLAGVLSDSDIRMLEAYAKPLNSKLKVATVMTTHSYSVEKTVRLDDVVREMLARRYGSAVVMDGGIVVGIFTARDALEALDDALSNKLPA